MAEKIQAENDNESWFDDQRQKLSFIVYFAGHGYHENRTYGVALDNEVINFEIFGEYICHYQDA